MGPELEKSKVATELLARKDTVNVLHNQEDELVQCISNYEDNNFREEVSNDGLAKVTPEAEDVDVNIIEYTKSGDNGQVETEWEDATESMSSFGDTLSENENGSLLGDLEVESRFDYAPASIFDDHGGEFQKRRKKVTDHWRRFIQPLMWRCKWIELQIREFQFQALKYDSELAEHAQRKLLDFDRFAAEGFNTKLGPFSSCTRRKKVMKRKKRKKVDEMTDITSYMLQHNLFSYYENRKDAVNGGLISNDCSNLDKAVNAIDEFGLQDGWPSFESKGYDNIRENFLLKIEVLQSQVCKLKAQIEKMVSEKPGKFSSVNRLSMPASCDLLTSSDQNPASPLENEDKMPVRSLYTLSHHTSHFKMGDLLPESAVSSHGEVTPLPDMIESTGQPQVGVSGENTGEGILIDNEVAKKEMQDLKNFGSQLEDKHQELVEMQRVKASEDEMPTETFVPRLNFGGKTLPKSRGNVSNNKRKQGRRKSAQSGKGGWDRRK